MLSLKPSIVAQLWAPSPRETQDYLHYCLFPSSVSSNKWHFLTDTLQILSVFLTVIIMNQHLLVPKHSGVFPEASL